MLIQISRYEGKIELYAVYYVVFGSLAGDGKLIQAYFWEGPYIDLTVAISKAEELKLVHNDDSFVVKPYNS